MPTDIATWLETRRVTLAPVDRDAIVGVGHALEALEGMLARIRNPRPGTVAPRGLLLTGPAGTGKTLCARWLAGSLGNIPAYDLPPDVLTPGRMRRAFAHLAGLGRSVVFLPEIDAVGRPRESYGHDQASRRTLFALLEALDGLAPIDPGRGPLVIATSNRSASGLDPALSRPLRLGVSVVFGLPDSSERLRLLERFLLGRRSEALDLRHLAELTRDWTPAALRSLVDEADGYALARGPEEPIADADCLLALRRASVREREPADDDGAGAASRWRSAVHEAGHAAVAVRLGQPVASIRIGASGLEGRVDAGRERVVGDDASLRATVVIAMGGIAAETLLLPGGGSLGGRSDVRTATRTLLQRIEAGIDPDFPPVDRSAFGDYAPRLVDELIVDHLLPRLERARREAAAIVLAERDAVERLARILLDAPVLAGHHLARALADAGLGPITHHEREDERHGPARPAAPPEPAGTAAGAPLPACRPG